MAVVYYSCHIEGLTLQRLFVQCQKLRNNHALSAVINKAHFSRFPQIIEPTNRRTDTAFLIKAKHGSEQTLFVVNNTRFSPLTFFKQLRYTCSVYLEWIVSWLSLAPSLPVEATHAF